MQSAPIAILRLPGGRLTLFLRPVNALSNLLGRRNDEDCDAPGDVISRAATGADVVPALRLILGANGRAADESQAMDFIRFTTRRGVNLSDLWVLLARDHLVWATLPMISPGRTMLLFTAPVEFAGKHISAVESAIGEVCGHFALRDVQLAQILLDPGETPTISTYERCGFKRMAELVYLQRTIKRAAVPTPLPAGFVMQSYSPGTHALFAKAILAGYENSLDCPPLNGLRSVEDIIAGHKSAGEFDAQDWQVLTYQGEPSAVLMLSRTLMGDGMELVYLGVSPRIRGHGVGSYLMRLAEARVNQRKLSRLTLAVDSLNEPALRLYYRHGMQRLTSKVAMMRVIT